MRSLTLAVGDSGRGEPWQVSPPVLSGARKAQVEAVLSPARQPRCSKPAIVTVSKFALMAGILSLLLLLRVSTAFASDFTVASDDWSCSPDQVAVTDLTDPFYRSISTLQLKAPRFEGHHDYLCDEELTNYETWANCLPITSKLDDECANSDRIDLLLSTQTLCHASVLHMLLVDVYAELQLAGGEPALVFGSLLGAVRDNSIISFTEDADIGYQVQDDPMPIVIRRLQTKGYHVFRDGIWRVCVAPTHPLAARLYDPMLTAPIESCTGPYLDLYRMEPDSEVADHWNIELAQRTNASIPVEKLFPYSKVTLNNLQYDTVADPVDFLLEEYGASYLRPTAK